MIECSKCGKALDEKGRSARVASIAGSIMGDETIESYYFCSNCQVYMVEIYDDHFSGEEDVRIRGPVSKQEGDAKVALIQRCSVPWDKKCRCEAHKEYFGGWLD